MNLRFLTWRRTGTQTGNSGKVLVQCLTQLLVTTCWTQVDLGIIWHHHFAIPSPLFTSLWSTFQSGCQVPSLEVAVSPLYLVHKYPQGPGTFPVPLCSPKQLSRGDVTGCLPLVLQSAFSQLRLTPGLRKVLFATALGTVALALAAHQLKRRRRRKKQVGPEMGGEHLGTVPLPILMAKKTPSVKKGRCAVRGRA